MSKYFINIDVTGATGTQTFECDAESKEEAFEKFKRGEGDFVCEEVDINHREFGPEDVIDEREYDGY